jgi:hypothetical protein
MKMSVFWDVVLTASIIRMCHINAVTTLSHSWHWSHRSHSSSFSTCSYRTSRLSGQQLWLVFERRPFWICASGQAILRLFLAFPSSCRKMPGYHMKIIHARFLPHLSQSLPNHFALTYAAESALLNKQWFNHSSTEWFKRPCAPLTTCIGNGEWLKSPCAQHTRSRRSTWLVTCSEITISSQPIPYVLISLVEFIECIALVFFLYIKANVCVCVCLSVCMFKINSLTP